MQRSFYVGDAIITEEDVKAKFEDGVLRLMLPKNRNAKTARTQDVMIE